MVQPVIMYKLYQHNKIKHFSYRIAKKTVMLATFPAPPRFNLHPRIKSPP